MNNEVKKELAETVKRYFVVNETKKEAAAEVKELGETIKDIMADAEISAFETDGIAATLTERATKSLDLDALVVWLGKKGLRIPDNCYVTKTNIALNVKAAKATKATKAA